MIEITWLGRLAHDLRGPLSPLQMAANLLTQPGLDPEKQRELSRIVERQVTVLTRMIMELGDWASIQEDRLLGPLQPWDLEWLLQSAIDTLSPELRERVRLDISTPTEVQVDSLRFAQAIATLIRTRAIVEEAGVLPIVATADAAGGVRITLGGPASEATETALKSALPFPGGEGLGLALPIAHAVIEGLHGTLTWEAAEGGRVWVCSLPAAEAVP